MGHLQGELSAIAIWSSVNSGKVLLLDVTDELVIRGAYDFGSAAMRATSASRSAAGGSYPHSTALQLSHAEFSRLLRRAGYPADLIEKIAAELPDPVDVDRDEEILARHGLTRDRLIDQMGGSP